MKKLIRLINAFDKWVWTNRTDNEPPSSGKEFDTEGEAVRDIEKRLGTNNFIIEERKPERKYEEYERD